MHIRILLLAMLCLPLSGQAITLQAEARAKTEPQAKREALAALADSILVNVQSESSSYIEGSGKRKEELRISSRSDIPLIGVEISTVHLGQDVLVEARLDSSKSLVLYSKKLGELLVQINTLDASINKNKGSDRYALLSEALTVIDQYEKYRIVSQLLGATQFSAPPRSRSDTEIELRALEKSAATIGLAAKILAKGLKADAVYIYPAMPYRSHEVTTFGRVMRDQLAQIMPTAGSPEKANAFFKGEYEILDNSIHLTYRLLDTTGNTLETRVATLAPAAYKGMQVKPTTTAFDQLLHDGIAVNNDFRVQLNTNRGGEDILFDEHEDIELLVKFSRPGYFYVVGHVTKKKENYSYLLELNHTENDRRFIRYVNADDANKWLSIGRFEATAPFGVESIQLIASSDDPINRLPSHPQDKRNDLYITATNAQQGISITRALKPKYSNTDKQYQAETVLMFTTMAKKSQMR